MGRLMKRTWRLTIFIVVCVVVNSIQGKPANQFPAEPNLESSKGTPVMSSKGGQDQPQGTLESKSRAVPVGTWEASARLPASSETGGNEHSRTKTDVTNGRTADYFTSSSRQRNNRRLHKIEDVPDHSMDLNDDLTHDIGTEDENPLVQSLTAMASSLTAEQSAENSSEKDVILSDDNSPSDQDTEASDVEQELEQQSSDENGTDEEVHPQMQSPTSESKTLSTSNFGSGWIDDLSNSNDNFAGRSSTTPKGLTTWSAVNGGGSQMLDIHSDDNTGFKGTAQVMPSDFIVSGVIGFNNKNPTTGSSTNKPTPTPIVTREILDFDVSTTEISRTTKSNSVMSVRKKPPLLINNRYKQKKPMPSKYVKTPPENLVATEIGSDDTHTTFQLKQVEVKPTSSEMPSRYTRRPGYPWPINPPIITTPRTTMAQKKAAFQKIGTGGTKRPNPYLKRTELPKLSLTTPTSTPTPASTTVYFRTPGVPLVNAFPLTLSNMPFFDFIRSQILPRIGLSLISFMATSPLILTLLGASAVGGRKKREAVGDTDISSAFDMSKFLLEGDKEENGSTTVKKHGALYETNGKDENSSADSSSFFSLFSKHIKPSVTKSSIVKKTKEAVKFKYGKGT